MNQDLTDLLGQETKPILELFRYVVYGVFVYLSIDLDIISMLSVLMFSDIVFGIMKAFRLNHKISIITLLWGFATKLSLLTIPMVVALMGKALGYDFRWCVDLAIKALIVNEGFSILANIISIKQNKDVENFDFISLFVDLLRDFFINKFKAFFNGRN